MAAAANLVWTAVDSSNVKSVAYHDASKSLCVEFHNGGVYAYHGVDHEVYVDTVHAQSVGKYLNTVVKVMYHYTRYLTKDELSESLG
jgi:hypothetical protein